MSDTIDRNAVSPSPRISVPLYRAECWPWYNISPFTMYHITYPLIRWNYFSPLSMTSRFSFSSSSPSSAVSPLYPAAVLVVVVVVVAVLALSCAANKTSMNSFCCLITVTDNTIPILLVSWPLTDKQCCCCPLSELFSYQSIRRWWYWWRWWLRCMRCMIR